jgi:hypothetical protein
VDARAGCAKDQAAETGHRQTAADRVAAAVFDRRALAGGQGRRIRAAKETAVLFGVAAAAFAGKAFGGILSDRFGWIKISVGALLISAPLLAFGKVNVR